MTASATSSGATGFSPTHVVPGGGLATWAVPDASVPSDPLDPLLPVRLLNRHGDWGQVLCSNGWSAWVDARLLVALPQRPPAAGGPLVRTADARKLLARVETAIERYRQAVEELAAGRMDGETFRATTRGLRIGAVVEGEAVWLYDAQRDHWCYCDGTAMTVFAPSSGPQSAPGPVPRSSAAEETRLDSPPSGPPPAPGG
ncbi:hypothetical protein BLA24_11570 [Streptomyces cinnamoneus]|uniref:SH3 domain-containing protein n=1 Tax=Streptomyces cinnamoneus TaxID=53446 RepID=A0A2G1XKG4_STRCJ|nr:hypothetical protein [Streptomyces cinnamoneus]PHQ51722.1 hypothetical protein BLA24_11570 [Streptomyces cinnamoneus]PPT11970.1 hypothetical protein CYQ11_02805 [Streptomyces cinnamoneus]